MVRRCERAQRDEYQYFSRAPREQSPSSVPAATPGSKELSPVAWAGTISSPPSPGWSGISSSSSTRWAGPDGRLQVLQLDAPHWPPSSSSQLHLGNRCTSGRGESKAKRLLFLGLAVLILSTFIVGFGNVGARAQGSDRSRPAGRRASSRSRRPGARRDRNSRIQGGHDQGTHAADHGGQDRCLERRRDPDSNSPSWLEVLMKERVHGRPHLVRRLQLHQRAAVRDADRVGGAGYKRARRGRRA